MLTLEQIRVRNEISRNVAPRTKPMKRSTWSRNCINAAPDLFIYKNVIRTRKKKSGAAEMFSITGRTK